MSSRRPDLLLTAALILAAALCGCTPSGDEPDEVATPVDVAAAIDHTLDARASAVRHGDRDAFEHWVGGKPGFRVRERTWFANLTQLPIARLRYEADPASLVREGDAYWVVVKQALELEGYDAAPVVTQDRYRFAPAPHGGRIRLTEVDDPEWEAKHGVHPEPWETGSIMVREGAGVLGIFDAASVASAPKLLGSVEDGIADVAARVPYEWSRSVVVYALSDEAFLDGIEDLPGDDPGDLDAVAFPAGMSTRFVLNPRMLEEPGRERDRLVRHELAHVAIGSHDDDVPVWLSEGLAEWVSVGPIAPQDRRIPDPAVAAAASGVDELPADASFNDADSEAHYGLSWWAVEYVADAYGDQAPWQLLDQMAHPDADPDAVLRGYGTSSRDLAAQADRLILATYDPGAGVSEIAP